MNTTRYLADAPKPTEITQAVREVFERAVEEKGGALLEALVPVDVTMEKGWRVLNRTVDYEVQELCNLVNYCSALAEKETDPASRARLQVISYCHVLEADLPMTVLWNLHRLLLGEECSWTFHRVTTAGKVEVCRYPSERIPELQACSERAATSLGDALGRLWQRELRNGFSHAQYYFAGGGITCTGRLSPINRTGTGIGEAGARSYTHQDIDDLYRGVEALLGSFLTNYKSSVAPYRDGNPHAIGTGMVYWDKGHGAWQWGQNR